MEAVKQTNGAYVMIPSTPAGILTGQQLSKIAELVNEGAGLAKLTSGQRIAIVTTEDKIDSVREGLASVGLTLGPLGNVIRNVKGCAGLLCDFGNQDVVKHSIELDGVFSGKEMPFAVKIGISGCARNCVEVKSKDIGFLATPSGYKVFIGGQGGGAQALGNLLIENVQPEEMNKVVSQVLKVYVENAKGKERLVKTVQRIGLEAFKIV